MEHVLHRSSPASWLGWDSPTALRLSSLQFFLPLYWAVSASLLNTSFFTFVFLFLINFSFSQTSRRDVYHYIKKKKKEEEKSKIDHIVRHRGGNTSRTSQCITTSHHSSPLWPDALNPFALTRYHILDFFYFLIIIRLILRNFYLFSPQYSFKHSYFSVKQRVFILLFTKSSILGIME